MNHIVEAVLGITLMHFDPYLECHVPSGERKFTYYFLVPDLWATLDPEALRSRAIDVANAIYREHGDRLRRAEPSDPNYLAVISAEARLLSAEEARARPWESARPPAWESSCCALVNADGECRNVAPAEFASS